MGKVDLFGDRETDPEKEIDFDPELAAYETETENRAPDFDIKTGTPEDREKFIKNLPRGMIFSFNEFNYPQKIGAEFCGWFVDSCQSWLRVRYKPYSYRKKSMSTTLTRPIHRLPQIWIHQESAAKAIVPEKSPEEKEKIDFDAEIDPPSKRLVLFRKMKEGDVFNFETSKGLVYRDAVFICLLNFGTNAPEVRCRPASYKSPGSAYHKLGYFAKIWLSDKPDIKTEPKKPNSPEKILEDVKEAVDSALFDKNTINSKSSEPQIKAFFENFVPGDTIQISAVSAGFPVQARNGDTLSEPQKIADKVFKEVTFLGLIDGGFKIGTGVKVKDNEGQIEDGIVTFYFGSMEVTKKTDGQKPSLFVRKKIPPKQEWKGPPDGVEPFSAEELA